MLELGEIYRLKGLPDSSHKYHALFRGKAAVPALGKEFVNEGLEVEDEGSFKDMVWIYIAVVVSVVVVALFTWGCAVRGPNRIKTKKRSSLMVRRKKTPRREKWGAGWPTRMVQVQPEGSGWIDKSKKGGRHCVAVRT
jgi:hypothetical protein